MDGNVALAWDEPGTPFDSTSVWNTPLPTDTPANPDNADYLNAIEDNACGESMATPGSAPNCSPNINNQVLNINTFSAPLYVVPANQPDVTLTDNCGRSTDFLDTISGGVPVPTFAHGAAGSDHEIQIYQPSTNEYWEFWKFEGSATAGWSACWGGEMKNVSSSDGVFPNQYGATATSLPLLGSVVRIEELQAGAIDHAIGLVIGDDATANLSSSVDPANVTDPNGSQPGVSLPATHGDGGSSNANAIPEGTRFRLPASLNLNNYDLTPIAKVIAVAAQKYGFIVNDSSPTPTLSMRLGDPTTYTTAGLANPYTSGPGVDGVGTEGLLDGGSQNAIMQNFPWNELQALPYDYGEPDFAIVIPTLASATPGKPYSPPVTLQATNLGVSTSPYTTTLKWAKVTLPKGMKLSSVGVLSGTPNKHLAAGSSSVTVKVTETVTSLKGKRKVKTLTTVQATIPLTIT
jgi:hypothetical protein